MVAGHQQRSKYAAIAARLAMTASFIEMFGDEFGQYDNMLHNGVTRKSNPWDRINLTKEERRGKTPEEIQAARKAKWEEINAES